MKLTIENIKTLPIKDKDKNLLTALFLDLLEINNKLDIDGHSYKKLYLDWQDFHNEYSPERTDPCPDYYGYYTLRFENRPDKTCGIEMDIELLDYVMCTLSNFVDFLSDFNIS